MRQKFNLDICMRPCTGFTAILEFIRKKIDGGFDEPKIDTTVFGKDRGMYVGVEWTNPPRRARHLNTHPGSRRSTPCRSI